MPAATHVLDPRGVAIHPRPDDPSAAQPSDLDLGPSRLWRRLVESRDWPVVHDDVPASVAGALLGAEQSFCAKVGASGFEPEVLRSAERGLAWTAPWALVLELAHVSHVFLAGVAERLPMFLLDVRTHSLVRLPGGNGRLVDSFLRASWVETRACVVANAAATRELLGPT